VSLPPRTRELAASFARVADEYDAGRPPYPVGVLDVLADRVGLSPTSVVLDLAAGTGRLTSVLTESGARVVAVEPLAELRSRIRGADPLDGTAEAIPLDDASVDVVTVGDAWHWFDGDAAAAEVARVLRPGGGIALLWQSPSPTSPAPWHDRIGEVFGPLIVDHPGFTEDQGRGALDRHEAFGPLREDSVPYEWTVSPGTYLAYLMSASFVASLPEERRPAVRADLKAALPMAEATLTLRFETRIWTARRR
jgi:SAM-dependent methyltransferase